MPIKYIGRTTHQVGKTLWEIVGNLKNFGVGRMIVRNQFQRYPEPSFMRILKVAALPGTNDPIKDPRKVMVLVEKTFRGTVAPNPVQIDTVSYKPDYLLVPKDEEHRYTSAQSQCSVTIVPETVEFPPLLREMIKRQQKETGTVDDREPRLKIRYNNTGQKNYRLAREGEKPTFEFTIGLGTPASPSLYANVKTNRSS